MPIVCQGRFFGPRCLHVCLAESNIGFGISQARDQSCQSFSINFQSDRATLQSDKPRSRKNMMYQDWGICSGFLPIESSRPCNNGMAKVVSENRRSETIFAMIKPITAPRSKNDPWCLHRSWAQIRRQLWSPKVSLSTMYRPSNVITI